jgi:hypothetical protein
LDGRKFAGETGQEGKTRGEKETFVLADGKYDPVACHKYGFTSSFFTAQSQGVTISFVAEDSNKTGRLYHRSCRYG